MPAKKEEKQKEMRLEIDEKGKSYSSAIEFALKQATNELDSINQQVLVKKIELKNLEDSLVKTRNSFTIWKQNEEEKVRIELIKRNNNCIERERSIEIKENNSLRRLLEKEQTLNIKERNLKSLEDELGNMNEERKRFAKERENLDLAIKEARGIINESKEIRNEANTKFIELGEHKKIFSIKEKEINDKLGKVNQINSELSNREDKLRRDLEAIRMEREGLEKVRAIVDPKLKEYRTLEEKTGKELEILNRDKADVYKVREENKMMLRNIETRTAELNDKEKSLQRKEEEVRRRELLMENMVK